MGSDWTGPPTAPPDEVVPAAPVYHLSPWIKRVASSFIDSGVFLIISYLGAILTSDVNSGLSWFTQLAAIVFGFWNLIRQGKMGQTIGKSALQMKLIREDNAEVVGPALSIVRAFAHVLDSFACMLGYFWPIWDKKRQTFADKACKTVVIDVPPTKS